MSVYSHGGGVYSCISTDAKPPVAGGVCFEWDTKKTYWWENGAWTEAQAGGGSGPTVKSGLVNLAAGGSANVTFTIPFSSVPVVIVTSQTNNADTSCTYSAHSVTANGFTLRGAGNPAGNVAWLATNAGNV